MALEPSRDAPSGIAHPSAVLAAYLEALCAGKRVVVLGDATIGLAEEILSRGARVVHAYDPEPARVAEAVARQGRGAPSPSFALLAGDLGVREGAFDVALVPDLALFADAADAIARVRLLVGNGLAAIASPNATAPRRLTGSASTGSPALGYYELFDAVSLQFSIVKMIGQAPFVGYTLADFASSGDVDVSVDTSLLDGSEEPEWFIAIASERPVDVDPYSVVELPFVDVADDLEGAVDTVRGADRLALSEAQLRVSSITAELEALRDRARDDKRESDARAQHGASAATRLAELEGELARAAARQKEAETRATDEHVRAERLVHQLQQLDAELRRQRDVGANLSKQLDDEKKARQIAENDVGIRSKAEGAASKSRIDALTAELSTARARIAELEFDFAETARRGPELEMARASVARVAELEAEIEVERARRRQLEGTLVSNGENAVDVDALERALADRGHTVRQLERDLRETERVGRELLADLAELSIAAAQKAVVDEEPAVETSPNEVRVSDPELRQRLDALSASAARTEADLQAAAWRIAQLERTIADAERGPRPADVVHRELEEALVAAREEIGELRRALEPQT